MRAEFLKARYGRVPQIVIVVLALGGLFTASLFAFLPSMIGFLVSLNKVIPNATEAQKMSPETLARLSFIEPGNQATVADFMGGSGLGTSLAAIGAAVLGALLVTADFRFGGLARAAIIRSGPDCSCGNGRLCPYGPPSWPCVSWSCTASSSSVASWLKENRCGSA